MKKLLLSSAALLLFSVAIVIFQISCRKTADAQTVNVGANVYVLQPASTTKLGGVIPDGTTISVDANGKIAVRPLNLIAFRKNETELWIANLDGTNQKKIPIPLTTTQKISDSGFQLTPDGKVAVFGVIDNFTTTPAYTIYSCNIDGSNFKKIVDGSTGPVVLEGAY